MECTPVNWRHVETHARASGRHHFLASPYQALHYARARGFIWASGEDLRYPDGIQFYVRPTRKELDAIWSWVAAMPNLVFCATLSRSAVVGNDRLSILNAADTEGLCRLVAARMSLPAEVARTEVMPELFLRMAESFSFRICSEGYPYLAYADDISGQALLWLQRKGGKTVPVPDVFDANWQTHFGTLQSVDRDNLDFLLSEAQRSAFVGPVLRVSKIGLMIRSDAFAPFEREIVHGMKRRVAGVFCERFAKAGWLLLP